MALFLTAISCSIDCEANWDFFHRAWPGKSKRGTEGSKCLCIPRDKKRVGYRGRQVSVYTPGKEMSGVQELQSCHIYPRKGNKRGTGDNKSLRIPPEEKQAGYRRPKAAAYTHSSCNNRGIRGHL